MKVSKPLIINPGARINRRVRPRQTTPTLHISIFWYVLLPRSSSRFNSIVDSISNVKSRTEELYLDKCGVSINERMSPGVGWLYCGENNVPCVKRLSKNGNPEMASVINNSYLKPPKKFFGRRAFTYIVVPGARFIDDPTLLGTTVTFGQPDNYSIYSFLTLQALLPSNPWIVAHEMGHALQNRVYNNFPSPNRNDPLNLMYEPVPRVKNPNDLNITTSQIEEFRQSSLLYPTPVTRQTRQVSRRTGVTKSKP
ncbi:hypothetical protein [Paenibacillus tepidiphilus]|uniref:hypothetical protein n=1 Tax=Paenibacillus tepidiphilus TaxID=2608683 RepID=UPI0012387656|nr:hypothetical protein [Paenibacillus tepidiphilus]